MFKEYRALLGIPAYAFNCLFGYLLMIIIAVALSVVGLRGIITSGAIDGVDISPALFDAIAAQIMNLLPWPFLFCCIAAPSAACSLSMEGSGAWIMATAPVKRAHHAGCQARCKCRARSCNARHLEHHPRGIRANRPFGRGADHGMRL